MKNYCLLVFAFLCITTVKTQAQFNSDNSDIPSIAQLDTDIESYRKKSKTNRIVAFSMLGGGLVSYLASVQISNNAGVGGSSRNTGIVLAQAGSLVALGSTPFFFIASRNNNRSKLLEFEKRYRLAETEELRTSYLAEATEYFHRKGKINTGVGIGLDVAGGILLLTGALIKRDHSGNVVETFFDEAFRAAFISSGVVLALYSIPFHIRGSNLKSTARTIQQTGRFPSVDNRNPAIIINGGQYLTLGVSFPL